MFRLRHRLRRVAERVVRETRYRRTLLGLHWLSSPERVAVAYTPARDMVSTESLLLYALTRALRPRRVLEIGAFRGGSGRIFANALEDVGAEGRIVGIDPDPRFEIGSQFHGRYELIRGRSPDDVPRAVARLGGTIDLAFIDGLHTHDAVATDLAAVLPHMSKGSHILLHDAYHHGISRAADDLCRAHDHVSDGGLLSRTPTLDADPWIAYAGLRLLRVAPQTSTEWIESGYRDHGREPPVLGDDIINHDRWHCANVEPCDRCRARNERDR